MTHPSAATQALFDAVRHGDVAAIASSLAAGADLSAVDDTGSTPLLNATWYDSIAAVAMLLKAGADPNVTNGADVSPLAMSVGSSSLGLACLLLGYGAVPDRAADTALMTATNRGEEEDWRHVVLGAAEAQRLLAQNDEPMAFLEAFRDAVAGGAYPCGALRRVIDLLMTGPDGDPAALAAAIVMDIVGRGWDVALVLSLLGGQLSSSNDGVRMAALYWLGEAARGGSPLTTALPDIQRLLEGEGLAHDVANAACLALGLAASNGAPIGPSLAAARWMFAEDETCYFVVRMAQRAARAGQDVRVVAAELTTASDNPDPEIRDAAAEALASVQGSR